MSPTRCVWGFPRPLSSRPLLSRGFISAHLTQRQKCETPPHLSVRIRPACVWATTRRAVALPWLSLSRTSMCLLLFFLCLTHSVQWFKQIQGDSGLGTRSCLSLLTWLQGMGRTERLGFPEIKALTHPVCMAIFDKKKEDICGSFWDCTGNSSIFLLSSLLVVPIGGFVVGRALQAQCQALQVTPRARAAPWTGLGAIQSTERTGELGAGGRISLHPRRH